MGTNGHKIGESGHIFHDWLVWPLSEPPVEQERKNDFKAGSGLFALFPLLLSVSEVKRGTRGQQRRKFGMFKKARTFRTTTRARSCVKLISLVNDALALFQGHTVNQRIIHHGGMRERTIRLRRNKPDRKGRPGFWKMRLTWVKDPRLVGKLYEVGLGTRDAREAVNMARGVQALIRALEGKTPLILFSESEFPVHRGGMKGQTFAQEADNMRTEIEEKPT